MSGQPLRKIAEGREAEIFAWRDGTVLRLLRNPDATRQVEWEAAAMRAAREAGVRVPAVEGVTSEQGRPGLIMERVDGPDMLTLLAGKPWRVFEMARLSGEVHAKLHDSTAPEGVPNLKEALGQALRTSGRVPERYATPALRLVEGLPDGDTLCHGDFHPGNVVVTDGGPVLIDWTGVKRGDPAADVARTLLLLRLGEPPPGTPLSVRALALIGRSIVISGYRRAYGKRRPHDLERASRWELPVAVGRLFFEGIESERPALQRILERHVSA